MEKGFVNQEVMYKGLVMLLGLTRPWVDFSKQEGRLREDQVPRCFWLYPKIPCSLGYSKSTVNVAPVVTMLQTATGGSKSSSQVLQHRERV